MIQPIMGRTSLEINEEMSILSLEDNELINTTVGNL